MTPNTASPGFAPTRGAPAPLAAPGAMSVARGHVVRILASVDDRVAGAVVMAVTLAIGIAALPTWPVGVFQDDGIYTVLAKALASGEGYRYVHMPGAPHATHYPPGYPLFLAALWKLSPSFPRNVAVFTFANAALLAVAAGAAYAFGRRVRLSTPAAATAAIATAAAVPTLIFGLFVMSEPMFLALLLLVLPFAERCATRGGWRDGLLVGLAGGALAMVRTHGMFVVPAVMILLVARRRFAAAACAAVGGAVFLLPWSFWVAAHGAEVPAVYLGKYGPYGTWLGNAIAANGSSFVVDVVMRNARAVYGILWTAFTGGPTAAVVLRAPAAALAALVLALGAWRLARRAPVTAWFLAAYMALVMIWPFEPTRFVWALLPLFGVMFALGAQRLVELRPRAAVARGLRQAALAACALLLMGYANYNRNGVRERWWDRVPRTVTTRAAPAVEWVLANTRVTDLIAIEDDVLLHLYTGRPTIPVVSFTAEEYLRDQSYAFATTQLDSIVSRYEPDYVVGTSSYGVIAARNLVSTNPGGLRVHALLRTAAVFAPSSR